MQAKARDTYRDLIAKGFSEDVAQRASGWHPTDEWERDFRFLAYGLVVAGVMALFVLWLFHPATALACGTVLARS